MKPTSISGVKYHVTSIAKTTEFYEKLGFRIGKRSEKSATCYVNWFWITFVIGLPVASGEGQSLYIKVNDIHEFYQGVRAAGMQPEGEPREGISGLEFTLRDPDGHSLVFFYKK